MKKLLALILALSLVLCTFTGCASTDTTADTTDDTETTETTDEAEETEDAAETEDAEAEENAEAETEETEVPDEIVIGLIGPSTGDTAYLGEQMKELMDLVQAELDEAGGINGIPVTLVFEDDAATSANAATAAQKMVDVYDVNAIVGPLFTSCVLAVKPIVNEAEIPTMIATSADEGIFSENGYVFSLDCANDVSVHLSTQYLYYELGYSKIAVLGNYNDQTVDMMNYVDEFWTEYGGEVVYSETFNSGTEDFRTQLTQIKSSGADCIWIRADEQEFLNMAKQIVELGLDDIYICTDYQGITDDLLDTVGSALDGRLVYTQNGVASDEATSEKYEALCEAYQEAYGSDPEAAMVLLYDCLHLVIEAMEENGVYEGEALRDAIRANTDYVGVSGYPVFDEYGKSSGSSTLVVYADGEKTTLSYTIDEE